MKNEKYSKVNWYLFDLKIKYLVFIFDLKENIRRKLHCNRDYHKIAASYLNVTMQSPGEQKITMINVKYFRCLDCNKLFFLSKEDKNKFLEYKRKNSVKYFEKELSKLWTKKWEI